MAYTTIDDPSAHFQTITYSGNGASRSITNTGNSDLKPDLVWIKERNNAVSHRIFDSSRGATKRMFSNNNDAESTQSNSLTAFNTDGFSLGDGGSVNGGSDTYVAWQWAANGGTTSSNSDGDITATVQANTTAGFSIMTWTSNNADDQTIGHGLGAAPEVFWVKIRDATGSWYCYFKEAGATHYLSLNSTDAKVNNVLWGDTHPTSSVITVDTNSLSGSTPTVVSYAFKQIQGYSKFGSYKGNITSGSDGTFVYTGFKPAWIMVKSSSNAGQEWVIFDNKRDTFNQMDAWLYANANTAEDSTGDERDVDFLSNGFKFRNAGGPTTYDGRTYIYLAFAEHPFVSSKGVPVTAR